MEADSLLKPFTWVTLVIVTIVGLAGIFAIPFVQDLVTASGYSLAEVFSGVATVLIFFDVAVLIFEVRT